MIHWRNVLFITHADVTIEPLVPVPEWGLSLKGKQRHRLFNDSAAALLVTAIYCSAEQKAIDGAGILSEAVRVDPIVIETLHENDRSATGFMPAAEFQATADLFFAYPDRSIRGWERAVDAQTRIVSATRALIESDKSNGDIAIVAHGGVGALLLCRILGVPISRELDQPGGGGGNHFMFDRETWQLRHGWRDIGCG
ncbi:MAG: histidine phosphatase family protein [Acetobacteraceae bacterium]|nr:histidine phosphatase family protein [Acetobacteraceae bacterium]